MKGGEGRLWEKERLRKCGKDASCQRGGGMTKEQWEEVERSRARRKSGQLG